MELEADKKLMLVTMKLDPGFYYDNTGHWCSEKHPCIDYPYVCSRVKGHTGLHIALTSTYPPRKENVEICECTPNPWS